MSDSSPAAGNAPITISINITPTFGGADAEAVKQEPDLRQRGDQLSAAFLAMLKYEKSQADPALSGAWMVAPTAKIPAGMGAPDSTGQSEAMLPLKEQITTMLIPVPNIPLDKLPPEVQEANRQARDRAVDVGLSAANAMLQPAAASWTAKIQTQAASSNIPQV